MHRYLLLFAIAAFTATSVAGQWSTGTGGSIYYNGGNVGVGTSAPAVPLDVTTTGLYGAFVASNNSSVRDGLGVVTIVDKTSLAADVGGNISLRGVYTTAGATALFGGIKAGKVTADSGVLDTYLAFYTRSNGSPVREQVRIDQNGRVGIGVTQPEEALHVAGNIKVSGNINAKYQDVAEWVPAAERLQPGMVVVLRPDRTNEVVASSRAYDTAVAGVVSEQPGITLGEAGPGKEMVATTGRVRVRVDATRAPVLVGDLLVTSDTAGMAMKSEAIDVGGVRVHRPGTIVGKALEPLQTGTGEILVLLTLQ